MCEDCGCEQALNKHHHHHDHPHDHDHTHPHNHDHTHDEPEQRKLVLEQKILSRNDEMAAKNRTWLAERSVVALNLISSPGSGKTMLLERTLERLQGKISCAVITGDQQTDNDAQRLSGKGAVVRQIETFSSCHLDADRINQLLPEVVEDGVKILFIENIGNLVCPSAFDLGENFKVALLSTTEGEDKPVKYPTLFSSAPITILTKMDLVEHLDWDLAKCREYLRKIHPGVFTFELSAKTGQGMDTWINYLESLVM
ncbi:MAG: hydrogenase nickel incorporation protein HypB [Kiritimatiellae bacterium]|nr:hydrogenase nickel incorporation protein HypB [Kiritimatiellia bacterium]